MLDGDLDPETRNRVLAALWERWGELITGEAMTGEPMPNHESVSAWLDFDFLSEMFLKMLTSPPDMPVELGAPISDRWIKTVIHNKRTDAIRAENRHERILRQAAASPGTWLHVRPGESAEATVMRRMEEADVIRRISRLPAHLRDVALLRYEGYSYKEIGQALGITDKAARLRIAKVRSAKVRAVLD